MNRELTANTPEEMFSIGDDIARNLNGGEVILLFGGLGAGTTLLTKGIMSGLGYDVNEVTSPSFTLVNLYETERVDVDHIDLWRLDATINTAEAVGLNERLENERAVTIIEWADRLGNKMLPNTIAIKIEGDGDEPMLEGDQPVTPVPVVDGIEPPRTGVEIVQTEERKGVFYHTMRDLRNGNVVRNVTRSSARKLWQYAITQHESSPVDKGQVQWVPGNERLGLWKSSRRAGKVRYDLVQRMPDGRLQVYYGVTEDGIDGPWRAFLKD